ncbi:unnamed protein product [Arctia plantaginis]|uniref:UDP-glucuronosyltransferase n=1 Tax=Arctia plantaginis TaxID=874455 RepID=A0A8S0ZL99_ARCPL|nr:unnamed protein product [Arctia plantaginis]
MPSKSHSILGYGVVDRLLEAGHEVVHITSFPKKQKVPNLKEIDVSSVSKVYREEAEKSGAMKIKNIITKGNIGDSILFNFFSFVIHKKILEDPNVVKLLSDPKEKFDAVILEWFFSELHAGIPHLFEVPMIWVVSTEPHWQPLRLMDQIPNPAYSVDLFTTSIPPLSFCERVDRLMRFMKRFFLLNLIEVPVESWVYDSIYSEIAAKRGVSIPSYSEAIYNGSLMFLNSHPSIAGAMPLPQNAINIAGYHIQEKIKPLPKNLQTIMDGAKNGVIYFSLGSNTKSDGMSEEMKQSLLKIFSKLDQTVIWKFESDMENPIPNVFLVKWAPQPSILAHPNLKLFITHGGQLSTTEAVHFGVPVVGIPVMADQHLNMASVESRL